MENNRGYNSKLYKGQYLVDEIKVTRNSQIREALKKMQSFFVSENCADSAKDVKKLNRIEIQGIDENGRERRLLKEIREKYPLDLLEDSEGYNRLFPVFSSGVIVSRTEDLGTYYTQFDVVKKNEEMFDLEILEYRYFNDVFYLYYMVYISDISIAVPCSEMKISYSSARKFLDAQYSRDDLKDFTDSELELIDYAFPVENDNDVDAIVNSTLSTFRVVNFINEQCEQNEKDDTRSLYNNEYFCIKNWTYEDKEETVYQEDISSKEKYFYSILNSDNCIKILETNTIGQVIEKIVAQEKITTFYSAVGFVFRSGLDTMKSVFENVNSNMGVCEMIIGSLQNYDDERANNKIDRNTVKYINELLNNKYMQIYTYKKAFYHGKFYYMSNSDKSYVIVGSSNISKTAFSSNYEMDVIHILKKGSEQDKEFLEWFCKLRDDCEKIQILNEQDFGEYNWTSELDAYRSLKNQLISKEDVKKKIEQLTDEETKFRLNLWIDNNPTDIYDDIDIDALKDYFMFVFVESKLVVFESFIPGNAYYVFRYRNSLVDLISNISNMTKTQMTCSAHYVNRGYHLQAKDKIVQRIKKYFD